MKITIEIDVSPFESSLPSQTSQTKATKFMSELLAKITKDISESIDGGLYVTFKITSTK
jgi:hypothetical protein